jgi:hypothetical protein
MENPVLVAKVVELIESCRFPEHAIPPVQDVALKIIAEVKQTCPAGIEVIFPVE